MHLSFTLTGASAFLLLVLGITEIALTRHGEDLTSGFASRGTSDLSGDLAGEVDMNLLPEHYKKGSTWAVLAAGILTTVTGLMGLLNAAWRSCREATSGSLYTAAATSLLGIMSVVVTLVALIYGMVVQSQSSSWHYSGPETSDGEYTVEGWACQMQHVMIGRQDTFNKVCTEAMAARWITIPLLFCGLALTLVNFLEVKSQRRANTRSFPIKDQEMDSI